VVAFGTSSPEIAVTVQSAFVGKSDLAIGNVVGSNIFQPARDLGLSAVITPLAISRQVVRLDLPLMIGASMLALLLAWNGMLGRLEGGVLLMMLLGYIGLLLRLGRNSPDEQAEEESAPRTGLAWMIDLGFIVIGLAMLVLGSRWLVEAALVIARAIGISELIVGLTIVAAGTSLPEVATSVIAALRGQRDIAVGNVIGSCTFNVLAVLGSRASSRRREWLSPPRQSASISRS
jgi:cation:H+ antiporter